MREVLKRGAERRACVPRGIPLDHTNWGYRKARCIMQDGKRRICTNPTLRYNGCNYCAFAGYGSGVLKVPKKEYDRTSKAEWMQVMRDKERLTRYEKFGYGMHMTRRLGRVNRFVTLSYFKKMSGWMWTNMVKYMRKKMPSFEYAKVLHTKERGRQHIHFVYRGEFIDVFELGRMWKGISGHGTVFIMECKPDKFNDATIYGYMDNIWDNVKIRWSYSRRWAPASEQALLPEIWELSCRT